MVCIPNAVLGSLTSNGVKWSRRQDETFIFALLMWSLVVPASIVSFVILSILGMWLVNVEKSSPGLIQKNPQWGGNVHKRYLVVGRQEEAEWHATYALLPTLPLAVCYTFSSITTLKRQVATVLLLHWYSGWISSSEALWHQEAQGWDAETHLAIYNSPSQWVHSKPSLQPSSSSWYFAGTLVSLS